MSSPIPTLPQQPSHEVRTRWAKELAIRGLAKTVEKRELLEKKHREHNNAPGDPRLGDIPVTPILKRTPSGDELEPPPLPPKDDGNKLVADEPHTVAIVGAGAAGLFTGMILDWLNKQAGPAGFHVDYEILESASTVGGRLFTYNFETGPNGNDSGKHLYYDVGAMRFPNTPIMQRTFDLFDYLGMKPSTLDAETPVGALIPYYMKNTSSPDDSAPGKEFFHFNDITQWGDIATINSQASSYDPFSLNYDHKIPSGVLANTPDKVMTKAIENFRSELLKGGPDAWEVLMGYDECTTRQYLLGDKYVPPPKPPGLSDPLPIPDQPYNWETINWLETFNGGTGWYDQAHSETVLESMDFEYPDQTKDKGWWCILGGANVLAQKMKDRLEFQPKFNVRVTGIDCVDKNNMTVWSKPTTKQHPPTPKIYQGVFNSTSLGCMREMNIDPNLLNYPIKEAMRSLGYGPSAKVGMRFRSAWWIYGLKDFNITRGGLGHSDLTIRTCVYPSYNYNVPDNTEAVLLCSYTWQQDGERIGSMMASTNNPNLLTHEQIRDDEVNLKNLVLRDLAKMHTGNPGSAIEEEKLYLALQESYIDHYAHDWTHNPNTAGAFAFFRPTQFSTLWPELIQPTSNLVIIGEAASPHHAWVVGALESAVHGVYSWIAMNQYNGLHGLRGAAEALELLKTPVANVPFAGLPDYMPVSTAEWHGFMGALATEDYLRERNLENARTEKTMRVQSVV